jgi:hypothetical protein
MPVRRRLDGDGAANWLPFAESKLRLLKERIRRYPGHIRTQWLTTDNGTDIYLEAGAIDEILIKTTQSSGGVAVLYTGASRQVTPGNPYFFGDTKYMIRVYERDKVVWETVQPVYDTVKNPFGLPIAPGDVMYFVGLQRFSVDGKGKTAAVAYGYGPYGYLGAAVNKNGLIGGPQDLNLAIDGTTFGSFCPINFGAQWGGKSAVLWPFANEHVERATRTWGMTRLANGVLTSKELHDFGQFPGLPPYRQSSARAYRSGVDSSGNLAYINRDYVWPQYAAGTYTIRNDAGAVLASSQVDGEVYPDTYPHGTALMSCGYFADGSLIYSKVTSTTTPTPGWTVLASLVHGGVTTTVYSFADTYIFMPQFVDIDTGAELAVISTGIASWLYDCKVKRLFALPYVTSVLDQQRFLIDNKSRRVIVDRRVAEKKIVTFSVNDKGELVRTDYAMPAGYQTLTFGVLLAMVENGKIAAAGNDGYTKLALGASGVSVTKDAYKKQLEAVVKDGETFTVRALAFSGNAHHLA